MRGSASKALAEATRKMAAVEATLQGKDSASSSSMARSYGVSVSDIKGLMIRHGVKDYD